MANNDDQQKKQEKLMREIENNSISKASKKKRHIHKNVPELGLELDTTVCVAPDDTLETEERK